MILDVSGLRSLVTGGTRGIGRAISEALAAGGARVAVNYKSNSDAAEDLESILVDRRIDHLMLRADVTQERAVTTMLKRIEEAWGGLDVLVVNHGIWEEGSLGSMALADWRETINTNLTGAFIVANEAVRLMRNDRSDHPKRIIFISSSAGIRGEANHSHYAASKGGLIAMTKSLAWELGPDNITVNSIAPGWIETDMSADVLDNPEERAKIEARNPLRRIGQPKEIAAGTIYLASRQAGFVNGQVLAINGGEVV